MAQESISAVQQNPNSDMERMMRMLQMIAASGASAQRRREQNNPYAATAAANRGVNNPTGVRAGTRKSSGGRSSGAKKSELQERAHARKKNRQERRETMIAENTAKTAQRKKDRKFDAVERQLDRDLEDVASMRKEVADIKAGRERDAAYDRQQPLDALTLMNGVQSNTPVDLPATGSYAPEGDAYESVRMEDGTLAPMGPESMETPYDGHTYNPPGFENSGLGRAPKYQGSMVPGFENSGLGSAPAPHVLRRPSPNDQTLYPIGPSNYADFDDQRARDSGPPAGPTLPGVGGMYQDNPLYPFSMNGMGAYENYPDFMTRPDHPGQNQMRNMPQGRTLEETGMLNQPLSLPRQFQSDLRQYGPGGQIPYYGFNPLLHMDPRRVPTPVPGSGNRLMYDGSHAVPLRPY